MKLKNIAKTTSLLFVLIPYAFGHSVNFNQTPNHTSYDKKYHNHNPSLFVLIF